MRTALDRRRILRLEAELARFDEQEVAAVGARVMGAIGVQHGVDAYEVTLAVTRDVLKARTEGRIAGDGRRRRVTVRLDVPDPLIQMAAGTSLVCAGCRFWPVLAERLLA
jgi:hypothetical protein